MLECVYAFLTLKNGIPIGYVLTSALMESAEIAYNVFDTYRGAEAAHVYARVLAMVHARCSTSIPSRSTRTSSATATTRA